MNNQKTDQHVPVLIIGGGIVGLSAAVLLLNQGIRPMLVERHQHTSIHPRARGFDTRTMEIYRELKISDAIREAGKALAPAWGILKGKSLASTLGKVKRKQKKAPQNMFGIRQLAALSPESAARCTQDLSEPVLAGAAKQRGADIRFNTALISFTQDEHSVISTLRNRTTGEEYRIQSQYLIATDGAKSLVRETLQAETIGKGPLSNLLNIYFEADLGAFVRDREFSICLIDQSGIHGMLTSINNSDRWVFHLHYKPAGGEKAEDYTNEKVIQILHQVIGLPGITIRIISINLWQPTIKVVTQMQHNRIFLAGDAAHVMTPYGGKGANTGIQDVHNLAWKLAAVIKNAASPNLLQTYNTERQPIGLVNALASGKWADKNGLIKKNKTIILGLISALAGARITALLGFYKLSQRTSMHRIAGLVGLPDYQYTVSQPSSNAASIPIYRKANFLNAEPGTRFPHIWVTYQYNTISSLDLLGKQYILFTGTDNIHWLKLVEAIPTVLSSQIALYSMGKNADLTFPDDSIAKLFGIRSNGAVLVRPDGFVAWRSRDSSNDLESVLNSLFMST